MYNEETTIHIQRNDCFFQIKTKNFKCFNCLEELLKGMVPDVTCMPHVLRPHFLGPNSLRQKCSKSQHSSDTVQRISFRLCLGCNREMPLQYVDMPRLWVTKKVPGCFAWAPLYRLTSCRLHFARQFTKQLRLVWYIFLPLCKLSQILRYKRFSVRRPHYDVLPG
jgi:hypothetical protein